MNLDGYVACICEGSAERAVIELLLENEKLIFSEEQLLEQEIIRCRNAKTFEERYLRKGFKYKITILRILDSRRESFKLSKAYADKINIINIITAPEIEMLMIFNENQYDRFKRSGKKPSEFCKSELKLKHVKNYKYVKDYFSNVEQLIGSIREYKRISKARKGEYTLCDLVKL